jgi:hypothetical protein
LITDYAACQFGPGSGRQQVTDRPDEACHLEGDLPGVAFRRGEDREVGAVAYCLDEHQAAFHLNQRLGGRSALKNLRRP